MESRRFPLRTQWQRLRLDLEAFSPGIQFMADAVENWCLNLSCYGNDGRTIIISGPFGCGKTRCLRAARRYVQDIRMEVWPQYWKAPARSESANWGTFSTMVEDDAIAGRDMLGDLLSGDVIFLDDIGAEQDRFKSGFPTRLLGDTLGSLEKRFVFITTNVSPMNDGWKKRWDPRVEDRLLRSNPIIVDLWQPALGVESFSVWKLKQKTQ